MPRPTSRKRKPTNNKQQKFTEPVPTVSELPVSIGLANVLRELDHRLFLEFGENGTFSYVIGGNGKVLSASNATDGIVVPDVTDEFEAPRFDPGELWQMPEGTKIEHPLYGVGEIKRAYRVDDTNLDDRVAVFGNVEFVLPAPKLSPVSPWDSKVKVIRPERAEINLAFSTRA